MRIPLDFLQGDKFREAAVSYIKPLLTKGVPSLFSDLSPLYDHPGKADMLKRRDHLAVSELNQLSHYSEVKYQLAYYFIRMCYISSTMSNFSL
ncbi:hypothetical protein ES319_D02G143300v1 [Gossypium barbadense]|uniref:Uncharacterized protein n=1 Tax=Gossypium barbadense TaxID=3634 RepID=A0A5J5SFK1_GOSBA|nr:hypothetical protein ES319_D02G143300v1 [Gossypium barbadense]